MAVRPWVSPQDVKEYTELKEVQNRSDEKLKIDITRAEQRVINITNNRFDDETKYPEIPEQVKIATILIAEAYAKNAGEKAQKNYKSETFDDYSYTVESSTIDLDTMGLDELLSEFVVETGIGKVVMKLRSL